MRAVDWIDRNGECMSRNVLHKAEVVEVYNRVEERACDKCGSPVDRNEHYNTAQVAHELQIYLNPEDCVNYRFRRDYCGDCIWPIWTAICSLIGADPDDISGSSFEDDDG